MNFFLNQLELILLGTQSSTSFETIEPLLNVNIQRIQDQLIENIQIVVDVCRENENENDGHVINVNETTLRKFMDELKQELKMTKKPSKLP